MAIQFAVVCTNPLAATPRPSCPGAAAMTRNRLIEVICNTCNMISADADVDFDLLADAILAEMPGPIPEGEQERVAMECARPIRGCATDEQYSEVVDRILRALRRPDSASPAPSNDWNAACDAIGEACEHAAEKDARRVGLEASGLQCAANIARHMRRPEPAAAPPRPAEPPSVEQVAQMLYNIEHGDGAWAQLRAHATAMELRWPTFTASKSYAQAAAVLALFAKEPS